MSQLYWAVSDSETQFVAPDVIGVQVGRGGGSEPVYDEMLTYNKELETMLQVIPTANPQPENGGSTVTGTGLELPVAQSTMDLINNVPEQPLGVEMAVTTQVVPVKFKSWYWILILIIIALIIYSFTKNKKK